MATVGIIGIGMVGRELERYFREIKGYKRGEDLFLYDIDAKKGFSDNPSQADVIFICVPTPRKEDGSCDLSAVESAFASIEGKRIVVLKSTVPPGTTEKLQQKYPHHQVLFSPEFLTESQAWEDMIRPDRQLVGFTKNSVDAARLVISLLPHAPFMSPGGSGYTRHQLSATEAEMVKIFGNAFFSMKVTFANLLADTCETLASEFKVSGIAVAAPNYENIKIALAADYRIGASHLDIYHGGYRGFGGYCLPKDLDSLINFLDSVHVDPSLLEVTREQNRKLIERQGLTLTAISEHNYKKISNAPDAKE